MDAATQKEADEIWKDIVEYAQRFWPRERTETLHLAGEKLLILFAEQCNMPGQTAYFVPDDGFLVVPDGPAWKDISLKDRPVIDSAWVSWLDYKSGLYD